MGLFGGAGGGGGTSYPKIPRDDPARASASDKPGTRYTLTPQQHMQAAMARQQSFNLARTGAGYAPGDVAQANRPNKQHYASLYGVAYKEFGRMRKVGHGVTRNLSGAAGTKPGSGGDEPYRGGGGGSRKSKKTVLTDTVSPTTSTATGGY